jgi:hypothetical protein
MATVRELIAKLGFEIDDTQAKQFQKTLGDVKTALNTFAIGKALSSASKLEMSFDQMRRSIEVLAGPRGIGLLEDALGNRVVSSVHEMTNAVKSSLETLSDATFTKKTIAEAEKLAAITGKTVEEVQGIFDAAASGQTIAPLQQLGLATQSEVEALQRMNIQFTTATIKQELLNRLQQTAARRQEQYNRATERADVQLRILRGNLLKLGIMIGKFLNPIIAKAAEFLNMFVEFLTNSKIGQFIAKVLALAGVMTMIIGVVLTLKMAFSALSFLMSPVLLKVGLIALAVVALGLAVEDLWLTFKDPNADTFFNSRWFKGIREDFAEMGESFDLLNGIIGDFLGGIGHDLFVWLDEIGEAISKFRLGDVIDSVKESISDITLKGVGEGALELIGGTGGIESPVNTRSTSSATITDNRKVEVVINSTGENAQKIGTEVKNAVTSPDFVSDNDKAMNQLNARDNRL